MGDKSLVVYYSCTGNTERVAELIKEGTGSDIFEIELKKDYSLAKAYTVGLIHASTGYKPKMQDDIDISKYDTIYLGTPVWMFTIAPALRTFIKAHNWEKKTIFPFCTDEGGKGNCFEKIEELCKGAAVLEGKKFGFVKNKSDEELKELVTSWLDDIKEE